MAFNPSMCLYNNDFTTNVLNCIPWYIDKKSLMQKRNNISSIAASLGGLANAFFM